MPSDFNSVRRSAILAVSTCLLLQYSQSAQAQQKSDNAFHCAISLEAAMNNLRARGYDIRDHSPERFTTEFKVSLRDSERRLLGSLSLERARQYQVEKVSESSIRFIPIYRETEFLSEGPGNRRDRHQETSPPITSLSESTRSDMKNEVCQTEIVQPGKITSSKSGERQEKIEDYLRDRCRQSDPKACQLLESQ